MDSSVWTAIGSIATVTYTIAFGVSVWMLLRPLRAQSLSDAQDRLQVEDVRQARRAVYELDERQTAFEDWVSNSNAVGAAEKVCFTYDYFAKLVRQGFLPKDLVLGRWAWQVTRLWRTVKPLVKKYRHERADQPRLWEDFQWLASESSKWLARQTSSQPLEID